jgi:formylglycine-generating enzyme required for sulfatase activity
MGLTVMDVRDLSPGQIKVVANCDTPGNARDIDVVDGYAYIADGSGGLQVMQINAEETPVSISSLALGGDCAAIEIRGGTAFVAARNGGVHVVDVQDPQVPVLLGSVVTPDARDVALAGQGVGVIADGGGEVIIFRCPTVFEDVTPPGAVFNLSAIPLTSASIELVWTAPGDDGFVGQASVYDIRYSPSTITPESWETAQECTGEPVPRVAGEPDTFIVSGLLEDTVYDFALKTGDEVPIWSDLSNLATGQTLVSVDIVLVGGSVSPTEASADSPITFRVTYMSAGGYAPVTMEVVIDGWAHALTKVSGEYETGAVFEYTSTLAAGTHEYYFFFEDGQGNSAETDPAAGPLVGIVFEMGSPSDEQGRNADENLHTVILSRHIVPSAHEVTQAEYEVLMGANPSYFLGTNRPVERVTWLDAILYCNALSQSEGYFTSYTVNGSDVTWDMEAGGWRLPTEAEWEYLCRGGSETAFYTGDITEETCGLDASLDLAGWYCGNADSSTHDVGQKQANSYGLHDTHGNVAEWCWDYYGEYQGDVVVDPTGPESGIVRVVRGGMWYYFARECRSAHRGGFHPNSSDDLVGFRVVRNQ